MGTYRTKPEEVEAVQYTGEIASPFSSATPAWVWEGLASGSLSFSSFGMTIIYNGMTEDVTPGDWLVLHSDKIIRACNSRTFQTYYTPCRTRRSKAEIAAYEAGSLPKSSGGVTKDVEVTAPSVDAGHGAAGSYDFPMGWGVAS